VIPPSQITPFARLVLSQLPAPNKPGYANNFESLPRRRDANDKGDAKFDHHFSDQVSAFVRLSQRKANNFEPPSIPGPSGGSSNGFVRQINQQLAGGVTYVPGVASLLEVRLGISRTIAGKTPLANGGAGMLELYGIPGTPTDASIAGGLNSQKISGFTDFGRQNSNPQFQNPFVINPRINYSKVISRHSVKAGYEYQSVNTDIDDFHPKYGEDDYTGQFSRVPLGTFPLPAGYNAGAGYNLADFLFGARSKYSITNTTVIHLRQRMHFGYLQDDYRVNRKLTLNLGLRYEFATPQWERDNRLSNFDPATNTVIAAKDGSLFDRSRVHPDRNNFAPRLGLAFSITPKTVIRSAYGISYIHFNRLGGENLLSYNGPTIVTVEVTS
jgi:Outer membrane receptor proteins, mostly Fe transport